MKVVKEAPQVLSIGFVVGGQTSTNSGWVEALRHLGREVIAARQGVTADINVNVEFHVPGNLLEPDFQGVRTGTFRKADRLLKVQVALPPNAPAEPREPLLVYLSMAVDAVDAWAQKRVVAADTAPHRSLIAALGERPPASDP
ncbi:hypothetical protein [Streptomyces sp.]|uniref:hypothetical protein n=1 Tax=Streptomyces sp. TaxID=1931 RepID=UPI00281199B1|nr:hypothetical protein [Streptomyces sp.]